MGGGGCRGKKTYAGEAEVEEDCRQGGQVSRQKGEEDGGVGESQGWGTRGLR